MFKIQTFNHIAAKGLEQFPRDHYKIASSIDSPDALLVRSQDLHQLQLPASVKAVGRAGAGVNNIPVAKLTEQGIPVFNAAGANANAVRELVLTGMLLASRHISKALAFTKQLKVM